MNELPAQDSTPWIVDANAQNFEQDVIGRSLEVPVVIDFWAEWCEPCKALGPILEKFAREGNGRFLLAKVDVDKNPELAQVFKVQSIPMVLALVGGRLADAFQGAVPPAEVIAFLDRVAPGGPVAPPADAADQATALAAEGDVAGAIDFLREHLRAEATDTKARLALVGLLLDEGKTDDASRLLTNLSTEEADLPEAKALQTRLAVLAESGDLDELRGKVTASPEDATARLDLGKALVANKAYEEGLTELLEAVRLDPAGVGAEAKTTMLATFEILGLEDPVANDFRFKLSLLLFA